MDDRYPSVPNGLEHKKPYRPSPARKEPLSAGDLFDNDLEMDELEMDELEADLVDDLLLDEGSSDWERDLDPIQDAPEPTRKPNQRPRRSDPPELHREKTPRRLAKQAARAGLSWGLQASTTPAMEQQDLSAAPDVPAACSGELRDAQELLALLARSAVETRREAEAEGLVAAMVPTALRLAPEQCRALWPAIPGLTQGVIGMTRLLRRSRQGRGLLLRLPYILGRTVAQLARHAQAGRPVDERSAATLLATQIHAGLQGGGSRQPTSSRPVSAPRTGQPDSWDEERWDHDARL